MDKHYILGVNIGFHDAAAALLASGSLVNLIEQERVSRKKHAIAQTPALAIKHCLLEAGIGLEDIAEVAIGWDLRMTPMGKSKRFTPERLGQMLFSELDVDSEIVARVIKNIHWVDHHLAHAMSAYYPSGEKNAAILIVDGAGEHCATTLARGSSNGIEILEQHPINQSIGFYYSSATRWAGFGDWGAGKLMGLASYGRPYDDPALRATDNGYEISINGQLLNFESDDPTLNPILSYFPVFETAVTPTFKKIFPYGPRRKEEAIAYADFAATVQNALEQSILSLARKLRNKTQCSTLVLAGGVAMNCSMIGRLVQAEIFDRIYVPPVPTDVGVALGAALMRAEKNPGFAPTTIDHAYWSVRLNEKDKMFETTLNELGLTARELPPEDIPTLVANVIAEGKIVGWAQGRCEIGERALGARSIVADPRKRENLEKLNELKGREMWRPVAPSILKEHYNEVMMGKASDPTRFMLAADVVRVDMRQEVPAITHVDGTARPQLVDAMTNDSYWQMINHFRELTGIPLVTNTSFNLADEPIVCTGSDALRTFSKGEGFDLLVVGNIAIAKIKSELDDCISSLKNMVV